MNPIEFIETATDDEIIEALATKVMGWTKRSCGHDPERYGAEVFCWAVGDCPVGYLQDYQFAKQWNPLRRLDHAFQVQAKVSINRDLFRVYILRLQQQGSRDWSELAGLHGCYWYLATGAFATAEQRSRAAFSAAQIQENARLHKVVED